MIRKIETDSLDCLCASAAGNEKVAYILYPMDILGKWIEPAAKRYGTDIVTVTGMDWESAFSPWPAKGVPCGSPDFRGESPLFLSLLQSKILPKVEKELGYTTPPERTLVGVSMSGLFALWQWIVCDTFANIACLSGSFWYNGFVSWMKKQEIPAKSGMECFLLGEQETQTRVNAFKTVAADTQSIISLLDSHKIKTMFESVPGNHYADPIPRLNRAFSALFPLT